MKTTWTYFVIAEVISLYFKILLVTEEKAGWIPQLAWDHRWQE
jgi:hypothetical protein